MHDIIYKQDAIDALYHVDEYNARSVEAIRNLPPAQPKTIRCKDCVHYYGEPGNPNIICFQMHEDDFCSYGERRKE